MAYDPSLSTYRDHVRLAVGDTGTPELLPDATYDAKLAVRTYGIAVAEICEALLARYAQQPNKFSQGSGGTVEWHDWKVAWEDLAKKGREGKLDPPEILPRKVRASVAQITHPDLTFLDNQRPESS